MERRDRLKKIIAEREVGDLEGAPVVGALVMEEQVVVQKEVFYTEGSPELQQGAGGGGAAQRAAADARGRAGRGVCLAAQQQGCGAQKRRRPQHVPALEPVHRPASYKRPRRLAPYPRHSPACSPHGRGRLVDGARGGAGARGQAAARGPGLPKGATGGRRGRSCGRCAASGCMLLGSTCLPLQGSALLKKI